MKKEKKDKLKMQLKPTLEKFVHDKEELSTICCGKFYTIPLYAAIADVYPDLREDAMKLLIDLSDEMWK